VIISAGTIKDSRENIEKFIRRNILGGIDHLVVLLDAPDAEVEEYLDDHPDVSLVRAYGDWWAGKVPENLNERQVTNHSIVSQIVVGYPWAEWVFTIDGDEVARIDRDFLDGVAPDVRAVGLTTMEAVSMMRPEHDPTLFKRKPTRNELQLLKMLGVIADVKPRAYFRGHISGKPGMRPTRGLALGVHHVVETKSGERWPQLRGPGLSLLHYESFSGAEFVRKWSALLSSGGGRHEHNKNRAPLAQSVQALMSLDLSEHDRTAWIERLYERVALDDAETLMRLGLLVELDPDAGERPRPPAAPQDVQQLRALLDRAYDVPKRVFRPRADHRNAAKAVDAVQRGL
jgi:hypothetical protein